MPYIFRPDQMSHPVRNPHVAEVSLAQLNAAGTTISWDEAVAIAQQTIRVLLGHHGTPIVECAAVFLNESGELVLRLSGPADPKASVRSVGELLRTLLAKSRFPAPLTTVITNATGVSPTYGSVAELSEALARYERPNRRDLIRRVYQRWTTHSGSVGTPTAIDSSVNTPPGPASTSSWITWLKRVGGSRDSVQLGPGTAYLRTLERRRRFTRNIYLAAFATVLVVAILASDWAIATAIRGTLSTVVDATVIRAWRVRPTLASVVHDGAGWIQAPFTSRSNVPSPGAVSSPSTGAVTNPLLPFRATAGVNRQPQTVPTVNRSGNATPGLIGTQVSRVDVAAQQNTIAPSPQPTADSRFEAAVSPDPSIAPTLTSQGFGGASQADGTIAPLDRPQFGFVYAPADGDVAPPVPLDPEVLDSQPSDSQQVVAFDIVVDANGRVETARLVSRPNNLRDAMLATGNLSAAKAWRFRPASKDGQPVKYRSRVWLLIRN